MLDISKLRNNFEEISKRIRTRNRPYEQLDEFKLIDTK
jgi:deoxyadenosine/deoxycytidine kinase